MAGFLLQKELDYLDGAVKEPKRPFVAIVGGSKVSSKIGVIESLIEKVDKIIPRVRLSCHLPLSAAVALLRCDKQCLTFSCRRSWVLHKRGKQSMDALARYLMLPGKSMVRDRARLGMAAPSFCLECASVQKWNLCSAEEA